MHFQWLGIFSNTSLTLRVKVNVKQLYQLRGIHAHVCERLVGPDVSMFKLFTVKKLNVKALEGVPNVTKH